MMITVLSVYFKLFHKTKLNPLSKLKGDFVTGTVSGELISHSSMGSSICHNRSEHSKIPTSQDI
jgi:hypothetical protein